MALYLLRHPKKGGLIGEKGEYLMETKKFIYYQEEDIFVGLFEEYPDYRTQDETIEELKENLVDIHHGTVGSYHC